MATAKKKTAKKVEYLDVESAAEYLGITPHDLTLSRYRGVAPGNLATKKDGVLVWERAALESAAEPEDETE